MFIAGAQNLEAKKEWINELNVFPVPDGDTGTNMTLTILSAAKEVSSLSEPTFETLAKAISSGSLRGARGNSGVILSQLFRGFTKEIKGVEAVDGKIIARAFERAVETAYKAVMKPKEGTILTVAKGVAVKAMETAKKTDDLEIIFKEAIEHGDYILSQTPEMLPVLKQAGVVDSGGQGLMQVLKGAYNAFLGKETEFTPYEDIALDSQVVSETSDIDTADIKFGYCTEFIIMLEKHYDEEEERSFKAYLESIGDSLVVVSDDDIVKIHVHTNDPGLAIQKALTYGSLTRMKIDNMREEHHERLIKDAEKKAAEQKAADKAREEALRAKEPRKKYGFISVSIGDGINEIFNGLGVDYIIEGGQTMNPSTEDILNAIDSVNADTVYVFPNNKNIILAANQAETLVEDKKVIVIPSKTIPQGITAIINFIPEKSPEENAGNMIEEMNRVKTGQVTYAVRDTELDGFSVKENDIMGIGDTGIVSVGTDIKSATIDMIDSLIDEESELISIYYGADVTKEDADNIAAELKAKYTAVEFEVNYGGQPIYYYVVSVE
ncbi:MAG: DAK2 domain-containing protein [Lachnospiraceae bacterium]